MEKIRLYHLSLSEESRMIVSKYINSIPEFHLLLDTNSVTKTIEDIPRLFPDLLIIDENISKEYDLCDLIRKTLLQAPYLGIVLMVTQHNSAKIKKYMGVGARGLLVKPFSVEDFKETILTINSIISELKEYVVTHSTRILNRSPKMISVFSTKGGVGKSTISTLIGGGLASVHKEDVAIVDMDLQFGDVSLLLDIKPKLTITNVSESIEQISLPDLRKSLTKHSSNMYVLPSPINPEEEEFIKEQNLNKLLQMLKEEFHYVIVDCPPGLDDKTIIALEQSDVILFITSPEVHSLKNTKTGLRTLQKLGIDEHRVKIIVNRLTKQSDITLSIIEDVLNFSVYATISEDQDQILQFLNQGQPDLIFRSKKSIGKDVRDLIEKLRDFHTITFNENKNTSFRDWLAKLFKKQ